MSSSGLRYRKNAKRTLKKIQSTQCPPSAVRTAGFQFYQICSARNIIFSMLILMVAFYTLKMQQASPNDSNKSSRHINEQQDVSEMIDKRQVLPLIRELNLYYHRNIKTFSTAAQQYFDQAMILSAAFNHDEAIRSLKYALMHDPKCAMCHWAIAYNCLVIRV